MMKLDIEGFEYKVLNRFLSDANKEQYPEFIITEFFGEDASVSTGNVINLLNNYGYKQVLNCRDNRILRLKDI